MKELRKRIKLFKNKKRKKYSGSDKNTLKSRIMSMDKGWIAKHKEIRNMNRTSRRLKTSII